MRLVFFIFLLFASIAVSAQQSPDTTSYVVKRTTDFDPDGKGSADEWNRTEWLVLTPRKGESKSLQTKVKALYSPKGLYFLFACEDRKITSTMKADFLDLWKEDVVEVFIQSDRDDPLYFEYELSPHNFELPILISNLNGSLTRWMPFHYEADRKTKRATFVASNNHWTAEFYIPYELLRPMKNHIPTTGARWKGNFYRVDYDGKQYASWTWKLTRESFHDPEKFGTFVFE